MISSVCGFVVVVVVVDVLPRVTGVCSYEDWLGYWSLGLRGPRWIISRSADCLSTGARPGFWLVTVHLAKCHGAICASGFIEGRLVTRV